MEFSYINNYLGTLTKQAAYLFQLCCQKISFIIEKFILVFDNFPVTKLLESRISIKQKITTFEISEDKKKVMQCKHTGNVETG